MMTLARIMEGFEAECREVRDEPAYGPAAGALPVAGEGPLTLQLKRPRDLPPAERPAFGQEVNRLKAAIETRLDELAGQVRLAAYQDRLEKERLDVTLLRLPVARGTLHPVKQVEAEICGIFQRMGYAIAEGPEIETDFFNFGAFELSAGPPGARRAGHVLHRRRVLPATHAHLAGPDPDHV